MADTFVFIGYEASATGAPFIQLYLIRWLKQHTEYRIILMHKLGVTKLLGHHGKS